MPVSRKALNYDLDDTLLRKYYPNPKSYKNAWGKVKKFLNERGFDSRQYSGVASSKPMRDAIVQEIVLELIEEFEWLAPCVERFDVTSITGTFDLNYLFKENKSIKGK